MCTGAALVGRWGVAPDGLAALARAAVLLGAGCALGWVLARQRPPQRRRASSGGSGGSTNTPASSPPRPRALVLTLGDVREEARRVLPGYVWRYYSYQAEEGSSARALAHDLAAVRLITRVLVNVSTVDLAVELLGDHLALPIIAAPTGFHRLTCDAGELASARGAAAAGACSVYNYMASTRGVEEVAAAARAAGPGPRWASVYILKDRAFVRHAVQEIERCGFTALVVTCDHPHESVKWHTMPHFEAHGDGAFLAARMTFANIAGYRRANGLPASDSIGDNDESLTWADVAWLKSITRLPVICKGVLSVADARLAVQHGADGIIVSNHGFRQMCATPTALAALPAIHAAVGDQTVVMVDSGFRRGSHVLKALALGARAVLIGRPILWGLAMDGEAGVARVFEILRVELEAALKSCGCTSAAAAGPGAGGGGRSAVLHHPP